MAMMRMYPTIITPFHQDGTIDYESLEKLVDYFGKIGCEGIFAVCQSSEMFFLDEEEKLELARRTLSMCRERGLKCVVSGHTQETLEDQIEYLKKLEALSPDAIILVNNRLALQEESEETAIRNLRTICSAMKPDTCLGIYECPHPYKRLLTSEMLQVMIDDGRFRFVKDTCCRIALIRERLELLKDTPIALYNANMATLAESMESGAAGYSGVMLNLMPEFFGLLLKILAENDKDRADKIFNYLSFASIVEYQNYPVNAKYCLMKRGILETTVTRNGKPALNESQQKELDAFLEVNRCQIKMLSE